MSISTDTYSAPTAPTVDDLCAHLERTHAHEGPEILCAFAYRFFTRVPHALLLERSVEQLTALAVGAFGFFRQARAQDANVQVLNPEEEGWEAPITVIRAAVSDRPFVVDTIREYLGSENVVIHYFIHPVLGVHRAEDGSITGVGEAGDGDYNEALVHCEISRIGSESRRAEIRTQIERRLSDVIAATEDFAAMLDALDETMRAVATSAEQLPERRSELTEITEFLEWLRQGNFVFLGFRSYDIFDTEGKEALHVEAGSGLGILRREEKSAYATGVRLTELSEELLRRVTSGPVLIVSKSNASSTVHRNARMDYIGIKKLDTEGRIVGERRFLGLFSSKAYAEHAETIPILRRKLEWILQRSGAAPGSHDHKEIMTIFNSMPKEDLFQASAAELENEVQTVLHLLFADEVRVTLRPDPLGRGVSVMVILPRGRFSGEVRHRIQDMLQRRLQATVLNYYLAISANDQARLHFYLSAPAEVVERTAPRDVEREILQIIRSWDDRLLDALAELHPAGDAQRLVGVYAPGFGGDYRAATLPEVALHDIEQMERMRRDGTRVSLDLREPRGRGRAEDFRGTKTLKLFLREQRLILSEFMPILENLGLRVIEVTPFQVRGEGLPEFMVYSFAVQGPDGGPLPIERAPVLAESILAVRRNDTPNDGLNALILTVGLRWREVDVLRTYANYVFQIGTVPSRVSIIGALVRNPEVARLVFELFRVRFTPDFTLSVSDERRAEAVEALRGALAGALQAVTSLADDRALRRLVSVVEATTRTNYFRHGGVDPVFTSGGAPYISIKIRSADVEELRRSRLLYEIFVFSSRMEGIHLRGAPVSRGGIRWSDRPDDFRTEVMGLVQTQIVKNAVIVPGGSKGGFVTKHSIADRDEMMREAADQYRTLVRGMLDITDNIVDGEVVPPPDVIRHDGDDPYLVVAADKGTAHLSDVANEIAEEYGFWLGDAFASGGSYGYDHKKEGITARGAWECVKRHFREIGKDIQAEPFTAVGIGDMSGDVFGNGMLLSRQIRLIAAFDHRHIFIDPDPDPATSYTERERLFKLSRSSWADYDRGALSAGAMIVPRASKVVTLTPEAREALGLNAAVETLDGEALVRAVLRAPVELLWNGGIGTYVKHPEETHVDAGDTANDPVRVDATELRCKVVGEGGNLGFTQRGRIHFALEGGRINTDAIDNSAGVDMSDHEVNLKILLGSVAAAGEMDLAGRNRLLEEMTGEVNRLVLRNNISQSLAVSMDEVRSQTVLGDFAALITAFERDKLLERGAEGIPSSDTLQERSRDGLGLTRPTLSVLLAYAKLHAKIHLLASALPDDPATAPYLVDYFPGIAVEVAGRERLATHRLRREIVTTELVNELVDLMGASFLHHAARDTGSDISDVVRAWLIASQLVGAAPLRAEMAQLESRMPAETVYRWYFGLARLLARTTRWVLANVAPDVPAIAVVDQHLDGLTRLRNNFALLVTGADRQLFESLLEEIQTLDIDPGLSERIITLRFLPQLLDILRIAQESVADAVETARVYYMVSERFRCAALRAVVQQAARDDRWEKRHAQALGEDVDRAHRGLVRALLATNAAGDGIAAALEEFDHRHARHTTAYRDLLQELDASEGTPLAGYAVAVRVLGEIASG
ncbi:MAG: NAD-glutamate dehydrogenase [Gemmatimonadetes bacterium]|nr:NAD-glutamate dehydrogenase [Gemmatimonadota bacterium]